MADRQNKNSNESPLDLEAQGKCPTCGGVGLWAAFGGETTRVTCPSCGK
jgi:uncharacterized protein (DUF983 family)